ncbi:MAG: SLBB domain-containing protein [Bacteroidetes bacterium]|nr:SLBB domain-containing protein [Bacteroidota bacterium]
MKKILLIIAIAAFTIPQVRAQIMFPFMGQADSADDTEITRADTDTPRTKATPPAAVAKEKPNPNEEEEIAVKKLELQKQKIQLEQEVLALTKIEKKSKEEEEMLQLKLESMKLLNAQEKFLMDQERDLISARNQSAKLRLEAEILRLQKEYEELNRDKARKQYPASSLYGHSFFRDGSFKPFSKPDDVVATESYILGTGDIVQLEVWGSRYWSKAYPVSESGSIDITGYQKIFVKGLSLRQARAMIASRLGISDAENSFSVAVTRSRMVTVNVLGEVFNPGTYTLPATNSVFNALVAMGGPSNIGSVRNIYIKRDGRIRDSFDLYEYFEDITHQRDVYLQNNDYIIVMPAMHTVYVDGSIRKPGTYELKPGETMKDLIRYAGGLYPGTYTKDIVVNRIHDNAFEVVSVNLDSLQKRGRDFNLDGAERVIFKSISVDNQYTVLINGAVSVPGTFRIKPGLRVSGLLKIANGLVSDAYLEKAYLVRTGKDFKKTYIAFSPGEAVAKPGSNADLLLDDRDSIFIFRKTDFIKFGSVAISGAVKRSINTQYISGLKLSQLIFMAGGLRDDADPKYGFITRVTPGYDKVLITFEPGKVMTDSSADIELMPKDEIRVYSFLDKKRQYNISISGPVRVPGAYPFTENTRIFDLVNLAGGLELNAYTPRAILISTDLQTGFMNTRSLNLKEIMDNPESAENVKMMPKDVLYVLNKEDYGENFGVLIDGSVRRGGNFAFSDNMTITNLIDMAGGLTLQAYKERALLIHTDLSTGQRTTQTIHLQKIIDNPNSPENVKLLPRDEIRVFNLLEMVNNFNVSIYGPVRRSGEYAYSDNMSLQNLIDLAGGMQFIAAGTSIEVVRNFAVEKGAYKFLSPIILKTGEISYTLRVDSSIGEFRLQPFDKIFVRKNPDFLPLSLVYLDGAVRYPGYYALKSENEKLSSLFQRAGGFRKDAMKRGIRVKRVRGGGDTMDVVINAKKAMFRKNSHYNYILKNGDRIDVPYQESIVTLTGDMNKQTPNDLGAYFIAGKRARYYVKYFGGGFTRSSDKRNIVVVHQNGRTIATRSYLLWRTTPRVKPGCKIVVPSKLDDPVKNPKGGGNKGPGFNIDKFLNQLTARTTAVLTLLAIFKVTTAK